LYARETWSLALREEHRLRVFGNRVLMRFRPKRDKVRGGWRKLHNEELHQAEEDEVGGTYSANGGEDDAYRLLVRKSEGKRSLGRPRNSWADNIEMNLVEIR
jgi:hypothetical protein